MSAPVKKLKVVSVHAAPDESYALALEKHLTSLVREERIDLWHPGIIGAGEDRQEAIIKQLDQADIIIPLLSVDFIHLPDTFGLLGRAVERFLEGKTRVLPVVVRAADYSCVRLDKAGIQMLPRDGVPISQWSDLDAAWAEVAGEVRSHRRSLHEGLSPLRQGLPHQTRNQKRSPYAQPSNRFLLGVALFAVLGLFLSVDASAAQQGDLETGSAAVGTKDPSLAWVLKKKIPPSFF